jgi:hypothetical protein
LPWPVVPVGVVVMVGVVVVVAGIGEVIGGIETLGTLVVSPESSPPQPAIASPRASVVTASALITSRR